MPNNDILDDLLVRPDKAVRKPEGVVEPARSNQGDESGYDLTNPSLHHGAEAKYAPTLQIVSKSGSIVASAEAGLHEGRTIGESSHLPVGDSGPIVTIIADQSAYEGNGISLNVSSHFAAPTAGEALTFSTKLPTGLSVDAHTGVISGTPTDGDFGNNPITVTATDAHGKAISESFNLAVGDTGPTATVIPDQSANEGQTFSVNVSSHFAAPAAGDALNFSAKLPAGLSIDAHTGIISGIPTDSDFGNNTVTVTATDAHGKVISESFHLQVGDSGPTATAIANQSAFEGQGFSLNVSSHFAAPAAGDALTFSAKLPAGLSINAHTGVISGTPTDSDFGSNPITVTATDAHGKAVSES